MKYIFNRTLETTVRRSSIIICTLASIACGLVVSNGVDLFSVDTYENTLNNMTSLQHMAFLFGIDGVLLILLVIFNVSGNIAAEIHEGTFKLLVTKPNSRSQILIAKTLASIVGLFLLNLLSITSYYATLSISSKIDGNIIKDLFAYIIPYIGYGLFIIIVFTGITTLFSCVFKKKIVVVLPVLALLIVSFGVFPIIRLSSSIVGDEIVKIPVFFDTNYQIGAMFRTFVETIREIQPNEIYSYLANLFKIQYLDFDITRSEYSKMILTKNTSLNGLLTCIIYLVISIASYIGGALILKKKDI